MPKTFVTDKTDAHLWQRFINGDGQAFAQIFNQYYKKLCNYGYKIIPDKDLIKDCVQDLFIHLWHNRSRLVYTDAIHFYLIKSLRGKLIRLLKKQKSLNWEVLTPELSYFELCFYQEENIPIGHIQNEQQDQLLKSLDSLPAKQKEIIYLRFFNDMSYLEIAEIMAINYQVVRNYACKAIKTLRKKVDLVLTIVVMLKQYIQQIDT